MWGIMEWMGNVMVTRHLWLFHIGACADVSGSGLDTFQLGDIVLHQHRSWAVM